MTESPPQRMWERLRSVASGRRELLAKLGWLVLIMLGLGWFKIDLSQAQPGIYIDGGYYTNVAMFVRDGFGLQTNVSLYHQAYSYFPHPTSVSPGWPLLYGLVARIYPLFDVGLWLPTVLYFTALFTAWGWGSSLMPNTLVRSLPHFDAGHVLALSLGIHREFFQFTSAPYTEGLAYTVLFAVLWRFNHVFDDPPRYRGIEVGLLLALALLVRAQLALLVIAMVLAVAWAIAVSPDRKKWLWFAGGAALTFVGIIGAYYAWLSTFVGNTMVDALLRFDQGWESDVLSTFHPMKNTDGLMDYVKDRGEGFKVAFDPDDRYAYRRSFWHLPYALPAAIPFFIVYGIRSLSRDRLGEIWQWARSSDGVRWLFVVLLALGGFFSIHTVHKDYFSEWHFHRRQGLTAILLFVLCLVFLFRRRWIGPAVAGLIFASSLYLGHTNLGDQVEQAQKYTPREPGTRFKSLTKWLKAERKKKGELTVAVSAHVPQTMAFTTPKVGYHWVYEKTTYDDIEVLFEELDVDYLILSRHAHRWRFRKDKRFLKKYRRVVGRSGMTIYAPK